MYMYTKFGSELTSGTLNFNTPPHFLHGPGLQVNVLCIDGCALMNAAVSLGACGVSTGRRGMCVTCVTVTRDLPSVASAGLVSSNDGNDSDVPTSKLEADVDSHCKSGPKRWKKVKRVCGHRYN